MPAVAESTPERAASVPQSRGPGLLGGMNRDSDHIISDSSVTVNGDNNRGRGRGGRRGGRARGGRGASSRTTEAHDTAKRDPEDFKKPGLTGGPHESSVGKRRAQDGKVDVAGKDQAGPDAPTEEDAEVCFICASPVVHWSVAPCNHRTCHICSLRLRALYKTKACAHCRTEAETVIFTDDAERKFQDFMGTYETDKLGIKYEKREIFEDTVLLLRYNCPDPGCDVACFNWQSLHEHVKSVHRKVMCKLCTEHKKVFTHEHELFTPNELKKHERFGDDHPGSVDQSGFKGHPECGFCSKRFYGDDELYAHCRDRHERCHICDRRSEGRSQQYFVNYDALELHFRKDHFLCPDQECLDKKFVVFETELDLKAHQLEAHPQGLSKEARRDARRVNMSEFAFRAPHEPERQRRREGRGRGRGRDPNMEPLPQTSAQPLRRDELAYQRQLAIHSAQSVSSRTFGGQLTTGDAFAARAPASAQEPSTISATRPTSQREGASESSTNRPAVTADALVDVANLTPQEQARRQRHSAVLQRASTMLRNNPNKIADFRSAVSSFRQSNISASGFVETLSSLFGTSSAELGKLINELAEIFEIPHKRDSLLQAWNDRRAINEEYPSLPGSSSGTSALATTSGGSRVLKLKSSTAQSSRSAANRQSSWSSASNGAFPPLPVGNSGRGVANAIPWSGTAASLRPSPVPTRAPSRTAAGGASSSGGSNVEAFPALPAAAKPTTTLFTPGYAGLGVRRTNGNTGGASNVWGTGASGASGASGSQDSAGDNDNGEGVQNMSRKKGNKNKKQTLFHFG